MDENGLFFSMKKILYYFLNKFSKQELKHLFFICLFFIFINILIYIFASLNSTTNIKYLGVQFINLNTLPKHYSYINQIKNNNLYIQNIFLFNNQHKTINIFWLISGLIAKFLNLSAQNALFLIKIFLIPIGIFSLYVLIGNFTKTKNTKIILIYFLTFFGGLSSFAALNSNWSNIIPLEFTLNTSNLFLIFYSNAFNIFILILLSWIIIFLLQGFQHNNLKYIILAGLLGNLMFITQTSQLIPLNFLLIIYIILNIIKYPKYFIKTILIYFLWFIISNIAFIYYLLNNPNFQPHNYLPINPITIIFNYILLLLLAVFAIFKYIKKQKTQLSFYQNFDFLSIWLIINFIILIIPTQFQQKFFIGFNINLGISAGLGFVYLLQTRFYKKLKIYNMHILLIILFIILSNIINIFLDFTLIKQKNKNFFINKNLLTTLTWLNQNQKDSKTILTYITKSQTYNNWITAFSNKPSFLNSFDMQIPITQRKKEFKQILEKNNPIQWQNFYKKFNINYILLEKHKSNSYYNTEHLKKIYENNNFIILSPNLNQLNQEF